MTSVWFLVPAVGFLDDLLFARLISGLVLPDCSGSSGAKDLMKLRTGVLCTAKKKHFSQGIREHQGMVVSSFNIPSMAMGCID